MTWNWAVGLLFQHPLLSLPTGQCDPARFDLHHTEHRRSPASLRCSEQLRAQHPASNFTRLEYSPMRTHSALAVLAILASLGVWSATASASVPEAAVASQSDLICKPDASGNEICYPRLFLPTHEFQPVHDDQEVPKGLYIRMNFQTGLKEAKIYVPETDDQPNDHAAVAVASIDLDQDGSIRRVDEAVPERHHHQQSPQPRPDPSDPSSSTSSRSKHVPGRNAFEDLVVKLQETKDTTKILETLAFIEDTVHQIDWAYDFARTEHGIPAMIGYLENPDANVREKAALVLGSLTLNNPKVQDFIREHSLYSSLSNALATEPSIRVTSRLLFAYGSLVRSNRDALQSFHSYAHGLSVLSRLWKTIGTDPKSLALRGKILTLLADSMDTNMWEESPDQLDLRTKYEAIEDLLVAGPLQTWCQILYEYVSTSEPQAHFEDAAKTLSLLLQAQPSSCNSKIVPPLRQWAKQTRKNLAAARYQDYDQEALRNYLTNIDTQLAKA
ncbi:uncharacterized protein BJ171DRAFT_503049 [Polychytrium aggregatum]|uniref:uncharacterized protein n=1 Tax=Polychytrium aggregatum TaxID=110093 RepID=UPI0022FE5BBD|nr:uncharacterized protein BJ171DRAFT_503049 [Polychytrium aggregatum]KAI9205124.1 hypothetical protein BJ171DRAFT_503049 [Polychytrium aggregatum]